jgi:hypothetical protein
LITAGFAAKNPPGKGFLPPGFPLRKAKQFVTVARNAIRPAFFAIAKGRVAPQKERAFQASSPKNFTSRPSGRLFFLPWRFPARTFMP